MSLIISFLILTVFSDITYVLDIFMNSLIPSMIIGIITKKTLNNQESSRYEPVFIGSIVFVVFTIGYYFVSKYILGVDILSQFLELTSSTIQSQSQILELISSNELLLTENIIYMISSLVPSMLFTRSIFLSVVIYLLEIYMLRMMKYDNLREINFKNFYLPGNAIVISFILYILVIMISYMNTPLFTNEIFMNLQVVFNIMFIIQGISVAIYFINNWLKNGKQKRLFLGAICFGVFGLTSVSFLGMFDSMLDFRRVRSYKSI